MTKHSKRLLLLTAVLSVAVTGSMIKPTKVRAADARQLSFYHTHTRRSLSVVYYQNGEYVESALDEINRFLKDFRTGEFADAVEHWIHFHAALRKGINIPSRIEVNGR